MTVAGLVGALSIEPDGVPRTPPGVATDLHETRIRSVTWSRRLAGAT
jgi:hypothetical protein